MSRPTEQYTDEELYYAAFGGDLSRWPDDVLLSLAQSKPDATKTVSPNPPPRGPMELRQGPITPTGGELQQAPEPGNIEKLTGLPIGGKIWDEATQQYKPYGAFHGLISALKSGLLSQPYEDIQGSGTAAPIIGSLVGEGTKYATLTKFLGPLASAGVSAGARAIQDDTPDKPTGFPKQLDFAAEVAGGALPSLLKRGPKTNAVVESTEQVAKPVTTFERVAPTISKEPVTPESVTARSMAGGLIGFEEDDNGNVTFNPTKAALGLAAGVAGVTGAKKLKVRSEGGRRFVNPLGTPEVVLKGSGIVESFEKAKLALEANRAELQKRLETIFKGIDEGDEADIALFKQLDDPNAQLTGNAAELRNVFDDLLNGINEHRVARQQQPVSRREGYITHLTDYAKEQSGIFRDVKIPNKLKFAFESRSDAGYGYRQSARKAVETYVDAALKDMYYGDALHDAVPVIERMNRYGSKPVVVTKSVTGPDGGKQVFHFYNLGESPLFSERRYAEEFVKRQLGWPTMSEKAIEGIIPSLTPQKQRGISQGITKMFYSSLLGAAVDTGVKNLTQGVNTIAELGLTPTLRGYAKLMTRGGMKAARSEHLLEEFEPLFQGGDKGVKGALKAFDDYVLGGPMRASEFVNRGVAYHAAMDEALAAGKSIEEAHEFARGIVRKTQFAYGKMDTSPFLQGAFTRPLFQFTSFPIKQSELMYRWMTEPGGRGKLLRYLATTGALVTGGMYADVDLSGTFLNPLKMVDPDSKEGFNLPGSDKRVSFDLGKLGSSGFVPQGPAPLISAPLSLGKGLTSDDPYVKERAIKDLKTMFVPGSRYGMKIFNATKEIMGIDPRDARGRKVVEANPRDAILKLIGLRSTQSEIDKDTRDKVIEVEKYYKSKRQQFIDATLAGDGETADAIINELSEKHPELLVYMVESLDQSIEDEAVKKEQTRQDRFLNTELRRVIDASLKK